MPDHSKVLRFRIELEGSSPLIWREIDVPADFSFWDLHVAIQDAMGWLDYHLHLFQVKDPESEETLLIGIPDEDGFEDDETLLGWEVPVVACLNRSGHTARYEYDFGDSWYHSIVLKEILRAEKGVRYPRCVGGQRSCPPEDVGGIHGYEEMLKALRNPSHPEHEVYMEWIGGSFDPDRFDPKAVMFDDPDERWEYAFGDE